MTQPHDVHAAVAGLTDRHKAVHRELQATRATGGYQAAEAQAIANVLASAAFIADSLGRPQAARALVNSLRQRFADTPPPAPLELSPWADNPEGLGTRMLNNTSTTLHDVLLVLGEPRKAYAVAAAEGMIHAAMGFLFTIGEGDGAREIAACARHRAEQVIALRDAPAAGGRQFIEARPVAAPTSA